LSITKQIEIETKLKQEDRKKSPSPDAASTRGDGIRPVIAKTDFTL